MCMQIGLNYIKSLNLQIMSHWLVGNANSFYLICNLLSYFNNILVLLVVKNIKKIYLKVLKTQNVLSSQYYVKNAKRFHLVCYHFTVNNDEGVSPNATFSKIQPKMFENYLFIIFWKKVSCREHQFLPSDMKNIIPPPITQK